MKIKVPAPISKIATYTFSGLGYVNRSRLLLNIKVIYGALPPDLQPIFHELLKTYRIIQPRHHALTFPELREKHLSKMTTKEWLDTLVYAFDTREGLALRRENRKLILFSHQKSSGVPQPSSGIIENIDHLGIRAILLFPEKPLTFAEILRLTKNNYPQTEEAELKQQLKHLRKKGSIEITIDHEYFWSAEEPSPNVGKNHLIQNGSLILLYASKNYVSQNGLEKRLKDGRIIKIFAASGSVYALKTMLETLEQKNQITKVCGEKNQVYYFLSKDLNGAKQDGRIVYGIKNGEQFLIYANRASIAFYSQEIYAREIEQLINGLKEKGEIKQDEIESFRKQLLAIYKLWEELKIKISIYPNIYLAQKVAQAKGGRISVLTALLSIIPFHLLKKANLEGIVDPHHRKEVLDSISNLKLARGIPFFIPRNDNHFIQNFMWYLIGFVKDPKKLELLLFDKLRALIFGPGRVRPDEIKYLYARLAERFEFADLPDILGNRIFRMENPKKFDEYETKIEEATGMSLPASLRYLSEFSRKLKEELEILGIPKDAVHIAYHRKTEASTYEKVEIRKHDKFENLWDLFQVRIVINSQKGTSEAHREAYNQSYLNQAVEYLAREYMHKHALPTDNIDDYIRNPKKSGWQGLTLKALGPQKKRVEILLMTQKMHENERFLRIRQMHFNYAIQRVLKNQKFDDYPYELIERLTGDPEHDYPLIRNHLLSHWVWIFWIKVRDPGIKLTEHSKKNLINLILEGKVELQIKRLPLRATPVDLASGVLTKRIKGQPENLIAAYGGAEIYRFGFDEKTEGPTVRPYDKRQGILPDWGINYQLQNGDIVFLRESDSPFGGKIFEEGSRALAHCQRAAAKITLRRLINDRALARDIERGKKELSERFPGIPKDVIQKIAVQYKFLSLADLHAAVGSGIITLTEIEEIYKRVVISVNTEQLIKLRSPDRKALIHLLFNKLLKNRALLQLYSGSPYYLFGERRSEIVFRIDPLNIDIKKLTEHILNALDKSERDFSAYTFPLTIRVKSTEKNWNNLRRLTEILEKEGINILHANLPEIKPGEITEGTLEVELPVETFSDFSMFNYLIDELKKRSEVLEV